MAKRWYVVHAFSGYEKRVMLSLQERIALQGMEDLFDDSSYKELSENPDEDQSMETNNVQSACLMIGEAN